jgi:hypothetical protein
MNTTLMVAWLAAALLHFTPQPETVARRVEVQGVAREMLATAFDDNEAPLYAGASARSHTALLEASVASLESQLRWDVQQGHCRKSECDGGDAVGFMQVQPGPTGLFLTDIGTWGYAKRDTQTVITAKDMLDPMTNLKVGLHFIRASLQDVGTLGEYTGEGKDGPLAQHRKGQADRYWRSHPAPFKDEELFGGIN